VEILAKVADFRNPETNERYENTRKIARISRKTNHNPRSSECLAGNAVLIAPVSSRNSLRTGNFAGNFGILRAFENQNGGYSTVKTIIYGAFPCAG